MNKNDLELSIRKAINFLLSQPTATSPGWGPERGQESDPWTTSQVLSVLQSFKVTRSNDIARAVGWLESSQNQDGSWWSDACGPRGDTMATACATIFLLERLGSASVSAAKGLDWLCRTFSEGWTTSPSTMFQNCHFYSTAYALRALARGPRRNLNATCIQEGVTLLKRQRTTEGAWGFQQDQPSDPTFTAYVLHALFDVERIWGLPTDKLVQLNAVRWLDSVQAENGTWREWHGIKESPEATGYILYILLSFGFAPEEPRLQRSVAWLLKHQEDDGGWVQEPGKSARSCNWVTQTVLMGLRTYLFALERPLGHDYVSSGESYSSGQSGSVTQTGKVSSEPAIIPLYSAILVEGMTRIPSVRPLDHTMYDALDRYVEDKLPGNIIQNVLENMGTIDIHGIYPDHFPIVAPELGLSGDHVIDFQRKPVEKRFNRVRPTFYLDEQGSPPCLLVCVTPGKDYFFHYASMIHHYVSHHTAYPMNHIRLFRYPDAEREIVNWTGLCKNHVKNGDRVVIGYVEQVESELIKKDRVTLLDHIDDEFYGSKRYRINDGSVIVLLGVKYSYWGSISELLCYGLCELGVSEIIYIAKLGALTKPDDIYNRIFCPSEFVVVNHKEIMYRITPPPPNFLLNRFPELDSGHHVSVPTVLEEDYQQRKVLGDLKAASIDNEISQIANAISLFNRTNSTNIAFSAIHFATDYIRRSDQKGLNTTFSLGNDKTTEARQRKSSILSKMICQHLLPYLYTDSVKDHPPSSKGGHI